MTDLVLTAASVVSGAGAKQTTGIAGETIAAGKAVYIAASGLWMLADSNSATPAARQAIGISLTGSSLNQPIAVHKQGLITIGGTLTAGTAYFLSDTPGGICPLADVGTGEYICQLGLATTAAVLSVDIQFPGVAL